MTTFCLIICCTIVAMVSCKGRLVDPPNRSSLWRQVARFPVNKKDSDLNCRGDLIPFIPEMDNWCGVCGDPIVGSPDHELGGRYVRRYVVTKTYKSSYIPVSVQVETFKGGYFEFSLCPHNFAKRRVSPECFREYRLNIQGVGARYYPYSAGLHRMRLTIPEEFVCRHCILQWRWVTEERLPQRRCMNNIVIPMACVVPNEIRNCADIAIESRKQSSREPIEMEDALNIYLFSMISPRNPALGALMLMEL